MSSTPPEPRSCRGFTKYQPAGTPAALALTSKLDPNSEGPGWKADVPPRTNNPTAVMDVWLTARTPSGCPNSSRHAGHGGAHSIPRIGRIALPACQVWGTKMRCCATSVEKGYFDNGGSCGLSGVDVRSWTSMVSTPCFTCTNELPEPGASAPDMHGLRVPRTQVGSEVLVGRGVC